MSRLGSALTSPHVITVAAYKGGVGKTTLALELAYLLNAVLVDLDWDLGGATRAWGYRYETRKGSLLLDALEKGRVPAPLTGGAHKADLVPSHPELADAVSDGDALASTLEKWAREWDRPIVVDTHPGGTTTTFGALSASSLALVPTVLATKELDALEGLLIELRDYPLMLAPNKVPGSPPRAELERLTALATRYGVPVAPPVNEYRWLPRRRIRVAVTSTDPQPARTAAFTEQLRAVTIAVSTRVDS